MCPLVFHQSRQKCCHTGIIRFSRFFNYPAIINDVLKYFIFSSSVISILLFSTHYLQPLAFASRKAAMTSSGYSIPSDETIEDTLARICFDCYVSESSLKSSNLNYSHRNKIKKENIYSNVTDLILMLFSNETHHLSLSLIPERYLLV